MATIETVRKFALTFPETDEYMHFEKPAFRIRKKIFATIHVKNNRIMVKLSLIDQSVFGAIDATIIYPVPGAWGKQGCTLVELKKVSVTLLKDLITAAYCNVAPPKLAKAFLPKEDDIL